MMPASQQADPTSSRPPGASDAFSPLGSKGLPDFAKEHHPWASAPCTIQALPSVQFPHKFLVQVTVIVPKGPTNHHSPCGFNHCKPALPRSHPVPDRFRTRGSSHLSAVTSSDRGRGLQRGLCPRAHRALGQLLQLQSVGNDMRFGRVLRCPAKECHCPPLLPDIPFQPLHSWTGAPHSTPTKGARKSWLLNRVSRSP